MTHTEESFKEILQRMYEGTHTKTQQQLAKVLGVQQSSVSDAQKRLSIPDSWLITLLLKFNLNPKWILDGVNPLYITNSSLQDSLSPLPINEESSEQSGMFVLQEPHISAEYSSEIPIYSSQTYAIHNEEGEQQSPKEGCMAVPHNFYKENMKIFRANSKAMEPTIIQNALVGVDTDDKELTPGEIYAFCLPPQGVTFTRVFYNNENNAFQMGINLCMDNKLFPQNFISQDQACQYLIGKVMWTLNQF